VFTTLREAYYKKTKSDCVNGFHGKYVEAKNIVKLTQNNLVLRYFKNVRLIVIDIFTDNYHYNEE
jgi:hypothetical protein